MKVCIKVCFFCFLLFSMAAASGNAANIFNHFYNSINKPEGKYNVYPSPNFNSGNASLDSVTKLLRLKLYIDQYNYDDIVIGFNSGASNAYDFNEDSKYMPGLNAEEGLASYSSDGIPLSVNLLPLPVQQVAIRLDVEAKNSGQITLEKTQLDQLPNNYSIWLIDHYLKDSLDLRAGSNYIFTINKADTASFGSYRFCVVVRQCQTPVLPFQLVGFNAAKSGAEAQMSWVTKNEGNNTLFSLERSQDGGTAFEILDTLRSTGAGSYFFSDNNPPIASDEYRLKITDQGGMISFSNTVTLIFVNSINTVTLNINVYPNPASNIVNLAINHTGANDITNPVSWQNKFPPLLSAPGESTVYNIKIVNISGSVIKTATSSGDTWQENITGLMPGTYIITVTNNSNNKLIGRSTFVKM